MSGDSEPGRDGRGRGRAGRGGGDGGGRGRSSGRSSGGRGRGGGGGGDGASRNCNNNNNTNSPDVQGRGAGRGRQQQGGRVGGGRQQQQRQQQQFQGRGRGGSNNRIPPKKPTPPSLQNGDKGADSHTVSESARIKFTKILMAFRENSDQDRLDFPATLTNTERKFVHEIAGQLGLKSKSHGKGENRCIVVTKINKNASKKVVNGDDDDEDIPLLRVGKDGADALQRHVTKFPPTRTEELEAHETGSSIMEALGGEDADVANRLQQLGLLQVNNDKEAVRVERPETRVNLERRKRLHAAAQKAKRSHAGYQRMLQTRAQLPAYNHQHEIVKTVAENAITIISGDTGCGKSTQVPQFILDANPTCSIVVTQPRRISAVSIAERVAEEQCQTVGKQQIGYQVRLDSAKSHDTQLLFMTSGVLLRQMQSSPLLLQYTTIILDEIHERDKYQEFLLIVLRDLIPLRPNLRVILMSATLQTVTLVDYFESCQPAVVEMQGRMFPVQEFFLEHVLELTRYVDVGDNGTGTATTGTGAGGSSRLEAELAKLLLEQKEDRYVPTLQCMICGKTGFLDGVELGAHVGLCAVGVPDVVDDDDNDAHDDPHQQPNDEAAEMEFEDYNVDEEIVLEDFDTNSIDGLNSNGEEGRNRAPSIHSSEAGDEIIIGGDASVNETTKKWDGKSPFEAEVETEIELSPRQENMLDQYQGMHDDEQIDNFLLLEVLRYIVRSSYGDGAILVFLPGWQEISEFSLVLEYSAPFSNRSKFLILPLHSGIPSKDQRRVLRRPTEGTRKIVLSTNLAETSLTIDDIAFVVDTGRAKEKNYDPHLKTSTLQSTWISQASAKQRKGRAGRTKAGVCFHLFSSRRHGSLRPYTESELLRTPLEELCLLCKQLDLAPGGPDDGDGVPAFLAKAMSPPHAKAVSNALDLLIELGAMLPETNDLTTLGECLATISLHPRVGKMVIWSYILGCARAACHMAVAMSYKSPFTLPPTSMRKAADDAKVRMSQNSESDQVTVHFALEKQEQYKNHAAFGDFCRRNFIGVSTMQMISDLRKNLSRELVSLGFSNPSTRQGYHNRHDSDHSLWQASITAGLYPNMALRRRGDVNFSTMTNQKVKVHVSSVNAVHGQPLSAKCQVAKGEIEFMCFGEIVKGARMFTANQTMHLASPLPLLLLCGTSLSVRPAGAQQDDKMAVLNMDDWIIFKTDVNTGAHIVVLRKRLESAFWSVVSNPSAGLSNLTDIERDAVEILGTVVRSAHKSAPSR